MAFKRKRRVSKKKVFRKKRSFKRKRGGIKRLVRQEVSRNVETKGVQMYNQNRLIYPVSHVNYPDNVWELGVGTGMTIVQGTGQGARLGNLITTKRLMYKGTLVPLPYDASTNTVPTPAQVAMYIFYDKTDPLALPAVSTNFLQNGSSSRGFTNDLCDLMYPINTDRYRVLTRRIFKLGYASYQGSGTDVSQQGYNNNDFKFNQNFSINLTKYYPKRVKFEDNNGIPNTRGLFCLCVPFRANGGSFGSTQVPCGLQFFQDYRYKDA